MPAPTPSPADAATLRALLARRDLGLALAVDESELEPGALDRGIRWIHSTDLEDPTPFLSEGLALLTTGRQFADAGDDAEACLAYVRRLTTRGLVALGFGTDVVRSGIPPALVAACRAEKLPLFEVPYRTPFIAVARANAEAISDQAYARRTWALAAQRAISLAALRPDGLGATLAELSKQLGTWVGLFDAVGALTREHPAGALDAPTRAMLADDVAAVLRRGARAGSSLQVGQARFTLQTLGRGGSLRGVIAIATGDLDHEGRGVLTAVIAMAGLAMEQNESLTRARSLLRSGLVHSLLTDDPRLAERIADDVWGGLPPEPIVVGAAAPLGGRTDAAADWLELRATESRGAVFYGPGDDGLVIVTGTDNESVIVDFADRFDVAVGLSDPGTYAQFSLAHAQARTARARGADTGAVRFAEVAASGVLAALDSEAARALAAARLAPLSYSDAADGTALIDTIRVWLDNDARLDAAATALGVHRHTVRARIAHAERLLDMDLSSFAARAEVWAALVAMEIAGSPEVR